MEVKKPTQYVYVAKIVDHMDQYLEYYHKIGVSKKLKMRENQLSPTHFPFDVQLVRAFRTHNMHMTESILHTCFTDYRIKKTYNKRKKVTEWFYVTDEDIMDNRIDKLVSNLVGVEEVDIVKAINGDVNIEKSEKKELINNFRKSKTRLSLKYNGEDLTDDTSTGTFLTTLGLIVDQCGWEKLIEHEVRITKSKSELRDRNPSSSESQIKSFREHWVFTGNNNVIKAKNLNKLIKKLNIKDVEVSILKFTPIEEKVVIPLQQDEIPYEEYHN
jgi:hypothetical protein